MTSPGELSFNASTSSEQKSPMSEEFVRVPGIIELRWTSDDPEYSNPATDLYYEQAKGIPERWENQDYNFTSKTSFFSSSMLVVIMATCRYGQKDPKTTEQAIFACLICECDIKSVKTLRNHIKGTKHMRGELQKIKVGKMVSTNRPFTSQEHRDRQRRAHPHKADERRDRDGH